MFFFFSSRRRHTSFSRDRSSDVCSSDLISLFLLSLSPFSHAAVYQWTDANGQTHFGDRPPAKASSKEVRVNAAPAQAEIGRASCRERVQISVGDGALQILDVRGIV